jgi:PAS domain S-box-containing protein
MDGKFIYANQHLANLLDYSVEELLNLSYWELTPEKYRAKELLQLADLKHTGRYGPYEKEYICKDGQTIPIRLFGVKLTIADEQFIWSVIEKVNDTDHLQVGKDKHKAYVIHTEKMAALGQLVAGVAHEINNPANFIHGNLTHLEQYSEILLDALNRYHAIVPALPNDLQLYLDEVDIDFLRQDLPKVLQSLRLGSERILSIVKSLRSFSRLDEAELKAVDVHEGIDDALMILQHRLKKAGVTISKHYTKLPLVECFPGELNQVLLNLLTNAIDATENVDQPAIRIQTELYGKHVAIRIEDNGKGIPRAIHGEIFNPFFTTKPVGKGTGLGLAISHQIITERHRGFLSFNSTPGEGTEFLIQLPLKIGLEVHPYD